MEKNAVSVLLYNVGSVSCTCKLHLFSWISFPITFCFVHFCLFYLFSEMNHAKDFRFDFLGALKCLCDCDDRLRNELAQFLEVEVCTIQASNNAQLFGLGAKLSLYFAPNDLSSFGIFFRLECCHL